MKYTQVKFQLEGILHKTIKTVTMDKATRLELLPDYDIFCVDLKEGNGTFAVVMHFFK